MWEMLRASPGVIRVVERWSAALFSVSVEREHKPAIRQGAPVYYFVLYGQGWDWQSGGKT